MSHPKPTPLVVVGRCSGWTKSLERLAVVYIFCLIPYPCCCDWLLLRVEEKLGQAGKPSGEGDGEGKDGAENEFVRASKEKFSGAQQALDDNSVLAKIR